MRRVEQRVSGRGTPQGGDALMGSPNRGRSKPENRPRRSTSHVLSQATRKLRLGEHRELRRFETSIEFSGSTKLRCADLATQRVSILRPSHVIGEHMTGGKRLFCKGKPSD